MIGVVFLISCNTTRQEEEKLIKYSESLMMFSPFQVTHFPKDLTQLNNWKYSIYYPESTKYNMKAGIIFDCSADSIFFSKTFESLKRRNIPNFAILSDSLFFIGDTLNDYSKNNFGLPVPSFEDMKDEFGLGGIRMNGKEHVYIIESQPGEYLEKDELVQELKLPGTWSHGFSRGMVVDSIEFRLTYWLVLW